MSDLIEEGVAVEKKFRDKIIRALSENLSDEMKTELIAIAGGEYFTDKLKMMFRFYEENREVQKAMAQERIDKEMVENEKKETLGTFPAKELEVLKIIAKYKTWATTAIISRESGHTWTTVEKYIQKFLGMGIVAKVPTKMTRKRRYTLTKDYEFIKGGQNDEENQNQDRYK